MMLWRIFLSGSSFNRAWLSRVILLSWIFTSFTIGAQTDEKRYHIQIMTDSADRALIELATQIDRTLIYSFNDTKDVQTRSVIGKFTLADTLQQMLDGTSLAFSIESDGAIRVIRNSKSGERNNMKKHNTWFGFIASLLSGLTAVPAHSDEVQPEMFKHGAIEEIVITATKRDTGLQETPVSVTAHNSDALDIRGISSAGDLQLIVPGLVVTDDTSGVSPQIAIRGTSTANTLPGGDPSVPIHINGHYNQATQYVMRDMLDVERVEVLRGPQGTLYGRNAIGGSINVITKRPTDEQEGMLSIDLGNYRKANVQAVLSGPFTDQLRGRLVFSGERRDGYVENISLSADQDDLLSSDYRSVRGSLEYDLAENIQLYTSAYRYSDKGDPYVWRTTGDLDGEYYSTLPEDYVHITNIDPFKVKFDTPNGGSDDAKGFAIDVDWDLESLLFRSLSAYDRSQTTWYTDLDGTDAAPQVTWDRFIEYETVSQELQLLSMSDESLEWIVGLFYYKEKSVTSTDLLIAPELYGLEVSVINEPKNTMNGESFGAYGNVDYGITENLALTFGARFTRDEKQMKRGQITRYDSQIFSSDESNLAGEWDKSTFKIGLNYTSEKDYMLFASYSTGFKSGGFNSFSTFEDSYDPETVKALEIGIKSDLMNDRLRINVSAFHNDYQDKQEMVSQFSIENIASLARIANVASATIKGVEMEVKASLTEQFQIDGSLSHLSATYDEFLNADVRRPHLGEIDLSGNQLGYAPDWKIHLGFQYDKQLRRGLGRLLARLDYSWVSKHYTDGFNREEQRSEGLSDEIPSYRTINAKLDWMSYDEQWSASLYVKNLLDDENLIYSLPSYQGGNIHSKSWASPRTYGVKVSYEF